MSTNLDAIIEARMRILAEHWRWAAVVGVLLVILGVVAIGVPVVATLAVELLFGWLFLVGGIVQVVHLVQTRAAGGFFLKLLGALLYCAAGVLLLLFPLQGTLTLTLLIAVLFIVDGVLKISTAFHLRPMTSWGWVFFSGLIAFALGILIWFELPSSAAWAIGLLVGINFLISGITLVSLALAMRGGPRPPAAA